MLSLKEFSRTNKRHTTTFLISFCTGWDDVTVVLREPDTDAELCWGYKLPPAALPVFDLDDLLSDSWSDKAIAVENNKFLKINYWIFLTWKKQQHKDDFIHQINKKLKYCSLSIYNT